MNCSFFTYAVSLPDSFPTVIRQFKGTRNRLRMTIAVKYEKAHAVTIKLNLRLHIIWPINTFHRPSCAWLILQYSSLLTSNEESPTKIYFSQLSWQPAFWNQMLFRTHLEAIIEACFCNNSKCDQSRQGKEGKLLRNGKRRIFQCRKLRDDLTERNQERHFILVNLIDGIVQLKEEYFQRLCLPFTLQFQIFACGNSEKRIRRVIKKHLPLFNDRIAPVFFEHYANIKLYSLQERLQQ